MNPQDKRWQIHRHLAQDTDERLQIVRNAPEVEGFDQAAITDLDFKSSQRILSAFTWEKIVSDYEEVFKG